MKNMFFITLILTLFSFPIWSETLTLKCESKKFGSESWVGNIMFVKINFDSKEVLTKEVDDTTVVGWKVNKLTKVTDDYYFAKQCIPSDSSSCSFDYELGYTYESYYQIDRTSGIFQEISKGQNVKVVRYEYQCQKSRKL